MSYQFFVQDKYKEELGEWIDNNLPYDHENNKWKAKWFPFYLIGHQKAIRVDVYDNDDSLLFALWWSSRIISKRQL